MKTIEERKRLKEAAEQYTESQDYMELENEFLMDDEGICINRIYRSSQVEEAYIAGAAEQKAIDEAESGKELLYVAHKTTERVKKEVIDKACEWLERYMEQLGYIDEWCRKEDEFIKAMEE